MNTFRLIQSGLIDAATNMAIDEALFLCYRENHSLPTLRIYGWSPASFSIGFSQNAKHLSLDTAFVRRPTGGGALFHDNELTYSFVASCQDLFLSSSVKESYLAITSFLIKTYELLGLETNFAKDSGPRKPIGNNAIEPFCQSRKEKYDIVANGVKIGGNAQKRRRNIFLQHGSLPLGLISEIKGEPVEFEDLSKILTEAFSRHFNVRPAQGELTQEELVCAERLKIEKYANAEWNSNAKAGDAKATVA